MILTIKSTIEKITRMLNAAFDRMENDFRSNQSSVLVMIFIFAGIWWATFLEGAILAVIFLAFARFSWKNGILAWLAIVCLVLSALFLSFGDALRAQGTSVFAFFFLMMNLVIQIMERSFKFERLRTVIGLNEKKYFKFSNHENRMSVADDPTNDDSLNGKQLVSKARFVDINNDKNTSNTNDVNAKYDRQSKKKAAIEKLIWHMMVAQAVVKSQEINYV
jgi:hypothetical protein